MKAFMVASLVVTTALGQSDAPTPMYSDMPSSVPSMSVTSAPSIGGSLPKQDCYTSTTDINMWLDHSNPFVMKEVIVCPHTTIEIGFPDFGDYDANEDQPLTPRRNTVIKCGEDGSRSNNCTLIGGQIQFFITSVSFADGEPSDNILIQGFKFSTATTGVVLADNPGDITFLDCEFVNHECNAPISMLRNVDDTIGRNLIYLDDHFYQMDITKRNAYLATFYIPKIQERFEEYHNAVKAGDREMLAAFEAYSDIPPEGKDVSRNTEENSERMLQGPTRLLFTFENCLFANNAQAPRSATTTFGIITLAYPGNDLILKNTTFLENTYGDPKFSLIGYAVESAGNNLLEIHDTCFIDNNFIGLAPVRTTAGDTYNVTNNYGTLDSQVTCQFIGYKESENAAPVCIDFDRTSCIHDDQAETPTPREVSNSTNSSNTPNNSSDTSSNSSTRKNMIVSRSLQVACLLLALSWN